MSPLAPSRTCAGTFRTRVKTSEFEGCDLVAIAGDVCPDARPVETHAWLRDVFAPWLDALPAPAVGIAGNHDFITLHLPPY
jgi:hypothetical protein